jgi:hypothetical protein
VHTFRRALPYFLYPEQLAVSYAILAHKELQFSHMYNKKKQNKLSIPCNIVQHKNTKRLQFSWMPPDKLSPPVMEDINRGNNKCCAQTQLSTFHNSVEECNNLQGANKKK